MDIFWEDLALFGKNTWNIRDDFDEYVKVLARTNNGLERYNKRLSLLFNTNRISILSFVSSLKKELIFQVEKLDKIWHGIEVGNNDYHEEVDYNDINVSLYVDWMIQQQDKNWEQWIKYIWKN